jgi:hypothetical protein
MSWVGGAKLAMFVEPASPSSGQKSYWKCEGVRPVEGSKLPGTVTLILLPEILSNGSSTVVVV